MKASKIIVIAAAAAAIGAAIPVSTLLIGSKELPEMPSGKYEPVAVTTTAASRIQSAFKAFLILDL